MDPFLSVIIPTYNRARVLPRSVASVLAQDGNDWELIIIDDVSTDETQTWLAALTDPRIRVILLDQNSGVNIARNRGVAAARGTWIVPLDSDDELTSDALMSIRTTIANTDAQWLLGRCTTRDGTSMGEGKQTGRISFNEYLDGAVSGEFLAVATRTALQTYSFPEAIRGGEHITWLAMARAGIGPYVTNAIWRIYDDTGTDRLTIKRANYARLAQVFRYDLRVWGPTFLRTHPRRFLSICMRAAYYTVMSLFFG